MENLNKGSKIQSHSVRDLSFDADRLIELLFFRMAIMIQYLKRCKVNSIEPGFFPFIGY